MLKSVFKFFLGVFRWARRSILLIGCIFFLSINVLTLTSGFVQSALSASLGFMGLSSVYSTLNSAIRTKKSKIQKQRVANTKLKTDLREASKGKTQLLDEKKRLSGERDAQKRRADGLGKNNQTLQKANAKAGKALRTQRAAVKSIGGRVTRRTMKSAAINVGSIPFESAPWLGAGVIAVVTMYELHMTCDNIKDMNGIYAAMKIEPEDDPGLVEGTCLGYIDRVESIVETVGNTIDMKKVEGIVERILAKVGIGDEQ